MKKIDLRLSALSVLFAAFLFAGAFGAVNLFGGATPSTAQAAVGDTTTVYFNAGKTVVDNTTLVVNPSNNKYYYIARYDSTQNKYYDLESTELGLYSSTTNSATKDDIARMTFYGGQTYYAQGNFISTSGYMTLRKGKESGVDGGTLVFSIKEGEPYVLTSVTLTSRNGDNWTNYTSLSYDHVYVTNLDGTIFDKDGNAVSSTTDSSTYAAGADVFDNTTYQFTYSDVNGFDSLYFSASYDGSGKDAQFASIAVTYKEIQTYTVSFDSDGGTAIATQTVAEGRVATTPDDPVKENSETHYFVFDGWYSDALFTEEYDFSTAVTENITLYAKFEAIPLSSYTMTFDSNGGTAIDEIYTESGTKFARPADPVKTVDSFKYNWTFDGWYTDSALTSAYDWNAVATDDVELYAKWIKTTVSTPSGAVYYNFKTDIATWSVTEGLKSNTQSSGDYIREKTLDSYETFDSSRSHEQLTFYVKSRHTSSCGILCYKGSNFLVREADATISLQASSRKVITYIRFELNAWGEGDNYLYANDGVVAIDSGRNITPPSGDSKNVLQATFTPEQLITSVKISAGNTLAFQSMYLGFADNPLIGPKEAAIEEIDALESDYPAAAWATVASEVATAKTNIEAATSVSAVESYLAAIKATIAGLDDEYLHYTGANVSLGESLVLNYYYFVPEEISGEPFDEDLLSVTFNLGGAVTNTVYGTPYGNDGIYKFSFLGIAPHRIGDEISVVLKYNGSALIEKTFVMTDYFKKLLSLTASELGISDEKYSAMETLIGDICDYAAAAQSYVDYNTSELVNEEFEEYASDEVLASDYAKSVSGDKPEGVSFKGVTVRFDGENKLYVAIKASAAKIGAVKVAVTVGSGETCEFTRSDFTLLSEGVYAFYTQSVKATEFGSAITLVITVGETEGQTLCYSVQAYVYSMQSRSSTEEELKTAALVKALWKYGLSAIAYADAV